MHMQKPGVVYSSKPDARIHARADELLRSSYDLYGVVDCISYSMKDNGYS